MKWKCSKCGFESPKHKNTTGKEINENGGGCHQLNYVVESNCVKVKEVANFCGGELKEVN